MIDTDDLHSLDEPWHPFLSRHQVQIFSGMRMGFGCWGWEKPMLLIPMMGPAEVSDAGRSFFLRGLEGWGGMC